MRPRRLTDGRDAHQTFDREAIDGATGPEEGVGVAGNHARLLRLFAGIDLDVEPGRPALLLNFARQDPRELFTIQRLDDIEEGHGLRGLVGLQRPDQVEIHLIAPISPTSHGLLDPVLAEHSLPRGKDRGDSFPRLRLGDSHQLDVTRLATRRLRRTCNPGHDIGKGGRSFGHFERILDP